MIKEQDLNLFREVLNIAFFSDKTLFPLINQWEEEKAPLRKQLGGLIVMTEELQVQSDKPRVEIEENISDYVSELSCKISGVDCSMLSDFLFSFSVGVEGFSKNRLIKNYTKDSINIPKGMKLTRALKFFCEGSEDLRVAQDLYTLYQREVAFNQKGRMFLSIHPMDFATLSDNNHNWTTCHEIEGSYQVGNFNYMTDEVTLVAYFADNDFQVPLNTLFDIPWNSKKWRALVHLKADNNGKYSAIIGTQYPFYSEELEKELIKTLKKYFDFGNSETYELSDLEDGEDIFHIDETFRGFTDISFATRNKIKVMGEDTSIASLYEKPMVIGGPFICVDCLQSLADGGYSGRCSECWELY